MFGLFSLKLGKTQSHRNPINVEWVRIFANAAEARQNLGDGRPKLIIAGGIRLCVALYDDRIHALADRCPHNGESLSKGKVNFVGEVVCPWHGYRYPLAGGPCPSGGSEAERFPVREDDSGVFVAI